ncbi:hypothetical protein K458DRAFT_398693 [Lentithecium fluviatile CBS 122367]|uniref:Uncharacterized protein n=1 Tax=Lentithecium fluviatile CBS 122367 TaxID=1168545 RepID=A0A6G1JKL5_9PLEO|nr:hypothetical protein K458DRAFT_398693 [Lentithecium fluviatile CBS 122367]
MPNSNSNTNTNTNTNRPDPRNPSTPPLSLYTHPRTTPQHYRNPWAQTRFPSPPPRRSPPSPPCLPYLLNESITFIDGTDVYILPWDYYRTWDDMCGLLWELGYDPAYVLDGNGNGEGLVLWARKESWGWERACSESFLTLRWEAWGHPQAYLRKFCGRGNFFFHSPTMMLYRSPAVSLRERDFIKSNIPAGAPKLIKRRTMSALPSSTAVSSGVISVPSG